jgi:predicted dienelactone hydrolase
MIQARSVVVRMGVACVLAAFGSRLCAAEPAATTNGSVRTVEQTWHDAARDRDVPVRIYLPAGSGRCPLIIFSHGLGGSREGYGYLGEAWASHGYVVIHVTHIGSDTSVLRDAPPGMRAKMEAMQRAANNLQNAINRPKDVSFAIDESLKMDKEEGPLHGRIDAEKIGVAGHSFGGYTAMAIAGQHWPLVPGFADPRVKAVVAMSPPATRPEPSEFRDVRVPLLVMTGTLDNSPIGETKAPDRVKLWEDCTHAERYLSVFDGGDHMVFSERGRMPMDALRGMKGDASKDEAFRQFILTATTHFWDAKLRGDRPAETWLNTGQKEMGKLGTWKVAPAE